MGNVHSVLQIAPLVSIEGAALRVRAGAAAAFERRYRASKRPSYMALERHEPAFWISNVNVGSSYVSDPGNSAVYLVIKGGGKWGYDDEFRAYLGELAELLEDARFFINDEYTSFIDEYALTGGRLTVERVVASDGVLVEHAGRLLRTDPVRRYTFVIQQARDWLELQEPDGALRWIDEAIEVRPASWEAHYLRAVILGEQAGHAQAIASLELARACLPPHALTAWGDAKDPLTMVEDDDGETVASALQRIECALGDRLAALDRFDEACAAWDRSFSITPRRTNSAPMLHQAIALLARGRLDDAERCLARAAQLAADRGTIATITYHRARLHARRDDPATALVELRLACELVASYRRMAREDEAFGELAGRDDFQALVR